MGFCEAKEGDFMFGNLLKGCPSRMKLKLHFWWCLTFSSQAMKDVYSPNNVWALFQAGSSRLGRFKDWILYGKHIENLCTGLPLYQLVATERKSRIRGIVSALGTFLPFEPKLSWYLGAVQTFLPIELHHKCFAVLRQKQKPWIGT